MDSLCLWVGRVIVFGGGGLAVLFGAGLVLEQVWKELKYRAYFIDMMAIYMRENRRAARRFVAAKVASEKPVSPRTDEVEL